MIAEAQKICDAVAQLVSTQTKSDENRVRNASTLPDFMDMPQDMSEDPMQQAALSAALLPTLAVGGILAEALQVNFIQRVRTGSLLSGAQSTLIVTAYQGRQVHC